MFSGVALVCCVVFFYRAGKFEENSNLGLIWAGLSFATWMGTAFLTGNQLILPLLSQGGLYLALTFWKMQE